MGIPKRIKRQTGRNSLVDGIAFHLPVDSVNTAALFAVFKCDGDRADDLLPGNEVHALRLGGKGLLVITVVDYRTTDIGKYIEFSIAIACTYGNGPARLIPAALFRGHFGTGQYVVDLPVSTEVSVKGGKGIWGMPKHQANLDYEIGGRTVSSQYDEDGRLGVRIEIDRPRSPRIPLNVGAVNYCAFRGMLMKSYIYFAGRMNVGIGPWAKARLWIGDSPRVQSLKSLHIQPHPLFTGFLDGAKGILDDHYESWFLSYEGDAPKPPEGMESVVNLGLGEEWLDPPTAPYGPDQLVH
jgi:hypothetical protein